jgi:scyllo-inositol 2-dehydrogenase (NADP+)
MHTPNVVVVGYGYAGRYFHIPLLALTPRLRLYGVVSARAEARAQIRHRFGVKTFAHVEGALADPQVDVIVLATPNDLHAPQAIAALQAGKHVVTDKPMCLNVAEADAMIAASRQSGRLLSVFQNRRWDGDFLTIGAILEQDLIGDPFLIETAWLQARPPRGWSSERGRGGGKFLDLGAHLIDQAVALIASPVTRVYARFYSGIWPNDVEDHAHCIVSFASGVDVHVTTSSAAHMQTRRWRLLGRKGTLVKEGFDPQEQALVAGDIGTASEDSKHYARVYSKVTGQSTETMAATVAETVVPTLPGRWQAFYDNLADVLQNDAALAVSPESSRVVMTVIEAAQQSAQTGQAISFESRPVG